METFPALLALCARNSPVPNEFPSQRPVTRSFDVFFHLRIGHKISFNKCLSTGPINTTTQGWKIMKYPGNQFLGEIFSNTFMYMNILAITIQQVYSHKNSPIWTIWHSLSQNLHHPPCYRLETSVKRNWWSVADNELDCVSNYQRLDCLPNRLFRRGSKKTSKFRVTGLCAGNSPVTGFSPHRPATRKIFPFDDVIMQCYYPDPDTKTL